MIVLEHSALIFEGVTYEPDGKSHQTFLRLHVDPDGRAISWKIDDHPYVRCNFDCDSSDDFEEYFWKHLI